MGVPRYFFSSSVCVYRDMQPGEPEMSEDEAIPANPDNEYGWEKLYSERVAMAYGRRYGMKVRIARFQNCYGPEGTWQGGREKAPAATCRKVAEAKDGGTIEVWGDGSAIRSYTYIADMVEGILPIDAFRPGGACQYWLPAICQRGRIGSNRCGSIGKEDPRTAYRRSGGSAVAQLQQCPHLFHRLASRNILLKDGIAQTYPWIEKQVKRAQG